MVFGSLSILLCLRNIVNQSKKFTPAGTWLWLDRASFRVSLVCLGPWALVVLGLSAAVYQPLEPDVFVVALASVGLSPRLAVLLAIFSTGAGGVVGYAIGRGLPVFCVLIL